MVNFGPYTKRLCVLTTSALFLSPFLLSRAAQTQTSIQDPVTPCQDAAGSGSQTDACGQSAVSIRIQADLVLVPVNVTDAMNRPVLGLEKDNFLLFDQAQAQQIRFLSTEDAPLTVGLILDVSNSMLAQDLMPNRLTRAKYALEKMIDMLLGDRLGLIERGGGGVWWTWASATAIGVGPANGGRPTSISYSTTPSE